MKKLEKAELANGLRDIAINGFNGQYDVLYQAADMLDNFGIERESLHQIIEKQVTMNKQLADKMLEMDAEIGKATKDKEALRNELCCKCGNYREAHNGACDGCRWKKEAQ